jgi:hypothetical protein
VVGANEELIQLRATIHALRNEMERQKASFDDRVQSIQTASRGEIGQLQLTIVELREQLEMQDAAIA